MRAKQVRVYIQTIPARERTILLMRSMIGVIGAIGLIY
jgi:hypothetical protein